MTYHQGASIAQERCRINGYHSRQLGPEDLYDVIERFDGYIAQHLGAGLMVCFGWLQAHEDDAQHCVAQGKQCPASPCDSKGVLAIWLVEALTFVGNNEECWYEAELHMKTLCPVPPNIVQSGVYL